MDRLTRWNKETEGAELVAFDTDEWKEFISDENMDVLDYCSLGEATDKLAEYEDTKLSPCQIEKLQEIIAELTKEKDDFCKSLLEFQVTYQKLRSIIDSMENREKELCRKIHLNEVMAREDSFFNNNKRGD